MFCWFAQSFSLLDLPWHDDDDGMRVADLDIFMEQTALWCKAAQPTPVINTSTVWGWVSISDPLDVSTKV